ncbi:MAG: hypothetical protein M1548_06805 [Actinobacteria bacterium]|nr:hypothetical protein [Actinomycetota bacterium]
MLSERWVAVKAVVVYEPLGEYRRHRPCHRGRQRTGSPSALYSTRCRRRMLLDCSSER